MTTLLFSLLVAGCTADNGLADKFDDAAPTDEVQPGTLRVDVQPADDERALLAQSFLLLPGSYEERTVTHEVRATTVVQGELSAETMQGFGQAASSVGPLSGVVRAWRPGLLQGGAAETDDAGRFSFSLPGSQAYSFLVSPTDATTSPLVYLPVQMVPPAGLQLDQLVEMGAPVYGRVTDAQGTRLGHAPLHLRRADADVRSATFTTDAEGWFVARVEPGYSYVLVLEGGQDDAGVPYPVVEAEFVVEDADGAQVDLDAGFRRRVRVEAEFRAPGGDRLDSPYVRATSVSLDTGSLVVEDTGTESGNVLLDLLPGTWTLEVWPSAAQAGLTPFVTTAVVTADLALERTTLAGPTRVVGTLTDSQGVPVGGATITAVELTGGGYTYSTTTDRDGAYALDVPRSEVRLQAVPADATSGAYTHAELDLADAGERYVHDIQLVAGAVLDGQALSDGEPVPYALIEVYDHAQGLLLGRTLTDDDGAYTLRVDVPELAQDTGDAPDDTGDEPDTGDAPDDTGDTADTGDTGDTADTGG